MIHQHVACPFLWHGYGVVQTFTDRFIAHLPHTTSLLTVPNYARAHDDGD